MKRPTLARALRIAVICVFMLLIGGVSSSCDITAPQTAVHVLEPVERVVPAYRTLHLRLPDGAPVPAGEVPGIVGADTVWLQASGDSILMGLITELGAGERDLTVQLGAGAVGKATFETSAAITVPDPEAVLAEVSTAMDDMVVAMETDPASVDHVTAARALASEFQALVATLTAAEKQELAAAIAAYPEDIAALGLASFDGAGLDRRQSAPFSGMASFSWPTTDEVHEGLINGVRGFFDVIDRTEIAARGAVTGVGSWWDTAVGKAKKSFSSLAALLKFEELTDEWDKVEFFPFKPGPRYEDLLAELSTGESLLAPEMLAASQSGDAYSFYNDQPMSFTVTHRYETLQLSDWSEAGGRTRELLDMLVIADQWWSLERASLARTLSEIGVDVSLGIVDLPDPRISERYLVPARRINVGAPSNSRVSCSKTGLENLTLTCSTDSSSPQEFSVTARYTSDFGSHELQIDGTVSGCWDASSFPGNWTLQFVDENGQISNQLNLTFEADGTFNRGTWEHGCRWLTVEYPGGWGTPWWERYPYNFNPTPGAPDTIPGIFTGADAYVELVRAP